MDGQKSIVEMLAGAGMSHLPRTQGLQQDEFLRIGKKTNLYYYRYIPDYVYLLLYPFSRHLGEAIRNQNISGFVVPTLDL